MGATASQLSSSPTARDVLADVLAVFGEDDRLQWGELAERLHDRYPERWHDVTGDAISAQLRKQVRHQAMPG
jgi:DNA segregation ATPase FtsK/SpoIIIE, S-DNA-T family